jgi:hypothetical protein
MVIWLATRTKKVQIKVDVQTERGSSREQLLRQVKPRRERAEINSATNLRRKPRDNCTNASGVCLQSREQGIKMLLDWCGVIGIFSQTSQSTRKN